VNLKVPRSFSTQLNMEEVFELHSNGEVKVSALMERIKV